VHVSTAKGERTIPLNDFYVLPGTTPNIENKLRPGELITHVSIPRLPEGTRSYYLKRRDRASYEFALASAAVIANVQGGALTHIRVALGGVGTRPWRSLEAEQVLENKKPDTALFRQAAEAAMRSAKPMHDNNFKIELAKRTLVRALETVTQSA
jgi:xanthine dehydrogenase YagS FAD-binding subunit